MFIGLVSVIEFEFDVLVLLTFTVPPLPTISKSSPVVTTANVSEVTNLYFTNARSRAAISVGSGGSYDNSTGIITITGGFVASSVTVFPGHSGNEDYGDLTTTTVDAFGVATGTAYDCMEPVGSLVSEDLVVL